MIGADYKHTQIGWVMIGAIGVVVLLAIAKAHGAPTTTEILGLAIAIAVLALFPTLAVVGDDDGIVVRFGAGLIRKRFRWSEIRSSRPVRNSYFAGWGIRWIRPGWMFNVSGREAVELQLRSGGRFRIGTDDPTGLQSFIQAKLARHQQG